MELDEIDKGGYPATKVVRDRKVPIVISRHGTKYEAEVTPPHGGGVQWSTGEPMTRGVLIDALRARGCHQTDIGDAFYEADPEWLMRD
jgi:hypothetical protein